MDNNERIKLVKAMEFVARQVNDEEVFEGWLINGVADGDIEYGSLEVTEDDKEILEGLRLICEHCGFKNVPLDTCWGLSAVRIYRIELDSITGKRNLPGGE